jgi:hypothetical protein
MNAVVSKVAETTALAPVSDQGGLMAAIARAASDSSVDVAKMQALYAMHTQMVERDAKMQYVEALAEFKASPPSIVKAKAVSFTTNRGTTSYKHATLDMVCRAIADKLADVGITHRWHTEQKEGGRIRVTCVLTHRAGHSEQTTLEGSPDESGGKNAIQAIGSAVTYLQRYTLLAATGLSTQDMDDADGRAPTGEAVVTITQEQADELQTLIEAHGRDLTQFKRWAKVEKLTDITLSKHAACVAAVKAPR